MARGRRTVSRMEKFVHQGFNTLIDTAHDELQSFQLDGGEVEAQVKRIMFSAGESGTGKATAFKLGLFQFQPSKADFANEEAIVISGAIGNQFTHNETITMRVPKDWYIGLLIVSLSPDVNVSSKIAYSLQLNYKVLN